MVRLREMRVVNVEDHPSMTENMKIFQETFQKPCQIYKFIREWWLYRPMYLDRTLSYVRKHSKRPVRRRDKSIDSIATRLLELKKAGEKGRPRNGKAHNGKARASSYDSSDSADIKQQEVSSSNGNSTTSPPRKGACYFKWICNNQEKLSQITRSYTYGCPWCLKDYRHLDSLVAHLKTFHSRFIFNLVEQDEEAVIEMSINPTFDGSYCGYKFPGHDLRRDFRFTTEMPERRLPNTRLLFFRPRRKRTDNGVSSQSTNELDLIREEDDEADVDVCGGRLFYHTRTCLPIKLNEMESDSEADIDPDWLVERTQLMIDEFTDVNEGEKEILKMWNLHIMKSSKYKSDSMIRQACFDFVERQGSIILEKSLRNNFILHLANLYEYGLLSSRDMLECIRQLETRRDIKPELTV